jgi:dTDP-4-dehydrorhamnose 3,5-epimerase
MKIREADLNGLLMIEPDVFDDERGYFLETWSMERYSGAGIPQGFVQDNLSFSRKGVLRGLHFQNPRAQAKLVSVLFGEVFDVAVDIRRSSPTFGEWRGEYLSSDNRRQIYLPPGFAHGFVVMSDTALFAYKCTEYYDRASEKTISWNDPDIGIEWPINDPIVSEKDKSGRLLRDFDKDELFP